MRKGDCKACSASVPLSELFKYDDRVLCRACLEPELKQAGGVYNPKTIPRFLDPTVCGVCQGDFGDQVLGLLAGIPTCPACTQKLRQRPLPRWLVAASIVLALCLAASGVRSTKYLHAEAALIRGERHLGKKEYAPASAEFAKVLETAPECKKALLLKIKADLLSDNFPDAYAGLERSKGVKFEGELIKEVNALLDRVASAMKDLKAAKPLMEQDKPAEALQFLARARSSFPESRMISVNYLQAKGSEAFDRKDYDTFLSASEEYVRLYPENWVAVGMVGSALAAKYAVTGEESFRKRAEEKVTAAGALCRTDQEKEWFVEYRERMEHRIKSKEILTKAEYDKRFRGSK
jgi:tetratricopeptide (TPR) repeat protein